MPSAEEAPPVTSLPVDDFLLLGSIREVNTGHDGYPTVFTPNRGLDNETVIDFGEMEDRHARGPFEELAGSAPVPMHRLDDGLHLSKHCVGIAIWVFVTQAPLDA